MILNRWAKQWGVSQIALNDLSKQLQNTNTDPAPLPGRSEAAVQNDIRLEATQAGGRLWRNNLGAVHREDGSFLRYGLANDTAAMNKFLKSSDLIGIRPILVRPEHTGMVIGQFIAREVKAEGWKFSDKNQREQAQLNFIKLILAYGGDACFATGRGTL